MPKVEEQNGQTLKALVLIGDENQGNVAWSLPYDPSFTYTDGQLRALYMRIRRIMSTEEYRLETEVTLPSGEHAFFSQRPIQNSSLVCVILHEGSFSDDLQQVIKHICHRGGVYSAKNFYNQILDMKKRGAVDRSLETFLGGIPDPQNAYDFLKEKGISNEDSSSIANLIAVIATDPKLSLDISVFNAVNTMLDRITESSDRDFVMDVSFLIANRLLEYQNFAYAGELFRRVADLSVEYERLTMEIACRIRSARIQKLKASENGMEILEILSPIDDGSLEAAPQLEREEYYCLQGYAYYLLKNYEIAEELYSMVVLIAEANSYASMFQAEAHWFLGMRASMRYSPNIATREYITSSSIASRNGMMVQAVEYSHLAAKQEIQWSKYLASTAIIQKMENNASNAEFHAWSSLVRLLHAISHSDPKEREKDLYPEMDKLINMAKGILMESESEYARNTLSEIITHLDNIESGNVPRDGEAEIIKFLQTKISAMIPFPVPVIMLIATDGRLIIGGQIGAENWDDSISDDDDLFSGALSAIMAILSEVISTDNPLRMVDAGTTQIMIEKSSVCIGALLVDRDLNIIRQALKETVKFMEDKYPELASWDGYSLDFSDVKSNIDKRFGEALEAVKSF